MAFQTGLEGKPWYVGAAVGLVLAAAIVGTGYYVALTPKYEEIAAQDRQLAELQVKIQEGRAAKQKLPQFREEVRRLELELDKLLRILPARRNTQDLLRRLRQLTEAGNFDLKRFTPGGFSDKEFYSEWPITVQLDGTYHNLALLFDRVSRFSRIINVENLNIQTFRAVGRPHTISASFVAVTFIYKEAPPPPPPTPGGAPPPGGRVDEEADAMSPKHASLVWALVLVLVSALAVAQPPADPGTPPGGGPAEAVAPAPAGSEGIDEILEGEELLLSDTGYNYDPGSRRDPFRSLLAGDTKQIATGPRPEGPAGMLIDEILLSGIFRTSQGWVAQVLASDKAKSYLIKEGDQLLDGDVLSISRNEVVFKQIVSDPTVIKPFREVVKKLNP